MLTQNSGGNKGTTVFQRGVPLVQFQISQICLKRLRNNKERSFIGIKAIYTYNTVIFKSKQTAFLSAIVFLVAVAAKIIPSSLERLTADSCIYMDIGRNLFSGKGFSISYNLYQFWANTPYYPAAPLFPPLFPFLVGIIWKMFHSLEATILLNVFLAAINSVLIYYLLLIVYKDITDSARISFWTAVLLSICAPMQQTSMFAWTEQLSLLFLLVAVMLLMENNPTGMPVVPVFTPPVLLRKTNGGVIPLTNCMAHPSSDIPRSSSFFAFIHAHARGLLRRGIKDYNLKTLRLITIGILFGLGFLTRVDMAFCFAAVILFLIVQRGINRESLRLHLCLVAGFLLIIVPYELFCIVKYNLLYPAYIKVNSVGYMKATLLGGYYDVTKIPVLQSNPLVWHKKMIMLLQIPRMLSIFIVDLARNIDFLIYFLTYRVYVIIKRNYFKERIFLVIGIVSLLVHSLFLSYQPLFSYIDIARFGLVHFLFFFILAMAGFYDFCLLQEKIFPRHYRKLFYAGLFIVAFSIVRFTVDLHLHYLESYGFALIKNNARDKFFAWIRDRTDENEVVAIAGNLIQKAFPLSRPIVSFPEGAFLNPKNVRDFFSIYKPSFVIMSIADSGLYLPYIRPFAHEMDSGELWRRFYCVYKIDTSAASKPGPLGRGGEEPLRVDHTLR